MSDWNLNGHPVLRGTVTAPLTGRWVADLEADTSELLSGAVELRIGGVAWRGFVARGTSDADSTTWRGRIVGGAGGLERPVPARAWHGLQPARGLITDLLAEAGEVLAASSTAEIDANLPRWCRLAQPAHQALADLARAVGCSWRVTSDGAVRVGIETWPELVLPDDVSAELLTTDPRTGAAVYALPGAWVAPGSTFEGRRVGGAVYRLDGDADRVHVWWADGT